MFFVSAKIKDQKTMPKYGVVEYGWREPLAKSQRGNKDFLVAFAMNYGGNYRDYYLFITEDDSMFSIRAKTGEDFMPIWENNRIVGLEFVPGSLRPKPLSRYQILLQNTDNALH